MKTKITFTPPRKQFNLFLICLFSISTSMLTAQTYVNKEWVQSSGTPDEAIDWQASVLDVNGDILITTNTTTAGQSTNILTTKVSAEDGSILWEKEYNHPSNDKDYGIAIATDAAGNVYVAGAANIPGAGYDFVLLKYADDGALEWSKTYDGISTQNDVPVAIAVDAAGNVYVTGGSQNGTALIDYCTIKYDTNGNQVWLAHYDYNSLYDAPIALQIDPQGDIVVTGVSAENTSNWESATIKYDASDGTQIAESRIEQSAGIAEPADFTMDDNGNFYITGKTSADGVNYDIRTIKLTANLDIAWVQDYDAAGFEDAGVTIDVDGQGNVFVGGYIHEANGTREALILSYDADGIQLSDETIHTTTDTEMTIENIKIKEGTLLITGNIETSGSGTMFARAQDTNNQLLWQKKASSSTESIGKTILIADNSLSSGTDKDVFITGTSEGSASITTTTTKYSRFERPTDVVLDDENRPYYIDKMVIVRFLRDAVITDNVDNTDIVYGRASTFLTSDAIAELNAQLSFDINNAYFAKVFRRLTTSDTISISRLGFPVPIPDFWTSFVVILPETSVPFQVRSNLDVLQVSEEFENTSVVNYAHPNYVMLSDEECDDIDTSGQTANHVLQKEDRLNNIPNDPEYDLGQAALHPTTNYPAAHINMESAWNLETGKNFIKVGVIEGGSISWRHDDFNVDGSGTFEGSKVVGGWIYGPNIHPSDAPQSSGDGHPTRMAGVIGALRNNGTGIAGIAGGDLDGENNSGVQLFTFSTDFSTAQDFSYTADAIIEASLYNPDTGYGYGIHILNNSYSRTIDQFSTAYVPSLLRDAVHIAFQNNVVFVASSGNEGEDMVQRVPANYIDRWVLAIGASGDDGQYKDGNNGLPSSVSNYGENLDVIAPGVNEITTTTNHDNTATDSYGSTCCSSSGVAHVSGVAGLLLSYHNDPATTFNWLAPEDVEYFIETTANDRTITPISNNAIGHDDYTGWGLLDAGAALQKLSECDIQHYSAEMTISIAQLVDSYVYRTLLNHLNGVPAGNYFMDVYKITATIPHNSNGQTITSDNIWVLNSASNLLANAGQIPDYADIELVSYNNNEAVLEGYFYHIVASSIGQQMDMWIPNLPDDKARLSYSLMTCNTTAHSEVTIDNIEMKLYPNPTSETVTVEYSLREKEDVKIGILDNTGKEVNSIINNDCIEGQHTISIDIKTLPSGLYMIQLVSGQNTVARKFVKE